MKQDNTIILLAGMFALWYFMREKANAQLPATTPQLPTLPPYQYTPPIVAPPIPEIEIIDESADQNYGWLLFPN